MRWISFFFALFAFILTYEVMATDCASFLKGRNLTCSDKKPRQIHLTFDDGPSTNPFLTPKVLSALEMYKKEVGGNATFFIAGDKFSKNTSKQSPLYDLLEQIKEGNFRIGSHAYKHVHHSSLERGQKKVATDNIPYSWKQNLTMSYDIPQLKKYLEKDGQRLIRLPYGEGWDDDNEDLMKYLKSNKMTHIYWDIDSGDSHSYDDVKALLKKNKVWMSPKSESYNYAAYMFEILKRDICEKDGGIILFHDIKPHTAEYLGCYLEAMKRAGHQHVPLETFNSRKRGSKPVIGHQYNPLKVDVRVCNVNQDNAQPVPAQQLKMINDLQYFFDELVSEEEGKKSSVSREEDYPHHVGSFANRDNVLNAIINEMDKGVYEECKPFDHMQDLGVYRVRCR